MVNDALVYSIGIGIAIGSILLITLRRITSPDAPRNPLIVFSFAIGFIITWWLYNHPSELWQSMTQISKYGVLIVIAVLLAVYVYWRKKKQSKPLVD